MVMSTFICKGSADLSGRETSKNSKWKYMSPPGIEPATLCFLAGHPDRLAIDTVDYLWFKLFQYSEMIGYAWGVSKHVAIQLIKLIMVIYVLQQNFRQDLHFVHKCRCYLLLFTSVSLKIRKYPLLIFLFYTRLALIKTKLLHF